ncbi:MAG: FKBP-type peptidyl-prolyl cis-trans isomerase [Prevotella sp.]|nr:FKBP-type peptidyl-prolyl cis-trans isomerase [Prevotella sp.]
MKKILLAVAVTLSATAFVSCDKSSKASLNDDVDSLSYMIGVANGSQMKQYLMAQGLDTTYVDDFLRGFEEGAKAAGDKKMIAYMEGQKIGRQMAEGINQSIFGGDSTMHVSQNNLIAGMRASVSNDTSIMSAKQAMALIDATAQRINARVMEKKYGDNLKAGEKFMADNAKKEGVKTLPSGLQYKVLTEGKGDLPTDTSMVKVNYEGKLINDSVFDSSYQRGQAMTFNLRGNNVIAGFKEALLKMPVGSTWEVYIPQNLAYGSRAMGQAIKPFSALIFKLELVSIEKK